VSVLLPIAAGLAGLVVGSFLNVCIARIPQGISIVFPGSRCPSCSAPIRARDNIPVLSWLLLGAKCRDCRAPISVRYPAVELGNAILWLAALRMAPSTTDFAAAALLSSACLVLVFIDYDFQILPDAITIPLAVAGFGLSFLTQRISWRGSLAGALLGAGGLSLIAWIYEKLAGQQGMGLGDAKMLGAIGAFTGVPGVVTTLFFAALAGSLVGLVLLARGGGWKSRLPFGVFLGAAGILSYYWAAPLFVWYRRLLISI
jgi:leader peptidase (prepilin peptidase)/N-methyltransferase